MTLMLKGFKYVLFGIIPIVFIRCGVDIPENVSLAYDKLSDEIDFNIDVKPILSDRCYQCHGPDEQARKGQLRFDRAEGLFTKTETGKYVFVPGKLGKSEAIKRILSDDPDYMMPPPESNRVLSAVEKAAIVKWVEQGAEWKEHWSFILPEMWDVPSNDKGWASKNEIDQFIQAKLVQHEFSPSPQAEKAQLLRRVTMDLTGLPPTISEINSFLNDKSGNAYDKVVEGLLRTDAYAERMTLEWLDVARYADSHGFHADGLRSMWPWRDWVIDAFRENMPYDQFVSEQLAGDLMPNATKDQIIATAFNRNHPMTAEGGVVDEEYRVEYVLNRTNTLGTAFLGLTVECARCHDHKFDPISQKEYYQLSAFFNNIKELGMTGDDGDYGPMVMLTNEATDEQITMLDRRITQWEDKYKLQKNELEAITEFVSGDLKTINPILHHSFEDITKTDSSEFLDGHPQSTHSGTDMVTGVAGQALFFNLQSDAVTFGEFGQFESTDPFSVSSWIKPDEETGKTKVIIGNAGQKNNLWRGWEFYLDSTSRVAVRLISSLPHNYIHIKTVETIPIGKWTQVLFSYDGSAKASGINIYIDGQKSQSTTVYDNLYKSILPTNTARTRDFRGLLLGKSYRAFSGDNGIFKGAIDEVSIFDVEVPGSQVESIYKLSQQGKTPKVYLRKNKDFESVPNELKKLRIERLNLLDTVQELMVMEEMDSPRPTFVLNRGEYNNRLEQVQVGTPGKVLEFSSDYPSNRLGLAQWLFDRRNPLTARVAVNRYWQMIFGRGIVSTANDFGSQGALPTHPKLLDWLALSFIESGWDIKALVRLMVTSQTYRQSSKASEELLELDVNNTLLARGSSYRWQAEFIRDNALAASGLLHPQVGGESAKPYQPDGLWIELGNFSHFLLHYKRDLDKRQYRRSMYTFIRRSSPPPFMTLFDAPSREVCTITRERTNTPLQALVLLNDPQFQEASRALAFRLKKESGSSLTEIINGGFQLVLSRFPSDEETVIFENLYNEEYEEFWKDQEGALSYLEVGDYKPTESYDPVEMAALSVLSNTLFNMDEAYMKR